MHVFPNLVTYGEEFQLMKKELKLTISKTIIIVSISYTHAQNEQ